MSLTDPCQPHALELEQVSKVFPGVRALDSVDLVVRHGEVHGIVGENGAGKSTLMGVASGALTPEAGIVRINGHRLAAGSTGDAKRHGIAIVRQEPALLPDLTVAENMYYGLTGLQRPKIGQLTSWAHVQLSKWSPDVGIDPDARVEALQPEQRFIVDIVRALAQKPVVLVLDEPTEHLAGEDVERLFRAVRERVAAGGAVVYISHRIREVKQIADRISVLRDGCQRGTFDTETVSEREIVHLIVGRTLDAEFPEKGTARNSESPVLEVKGMQGRGFHDLSFEVHSGEIVGFAGIEGNGQRDAVRSLSGLARRTGSVIVDGRIVRGQPHQIAYLTGDRHREGIFPGLSVRETLGLRNLEEISTLGLVIGRWERDLARQSVTDLRVKTPSLDTAIESLSGGNQQKVLMAGVLRHGSRVLIVDEPTQGVDVGAKTEIYEFLRSESAERGTAVLVVSSDGRELAGLCDRVLCFSRGHVVGELVGAAVSETAITEVLLTATTQRITDTNRAGRPVQWLAGDSAPLAMVAVAILLLGLVTSGKSPFYLTAANISLTLALVTVLGFAALGQTVALVVGAIDLSVGPLMGFVVVVESFFLTVGATPSSQALGWLLLVAIPIAIGLFNWLLVDLVKLNAIVATLITYIALQALSLVLRPQPSGQFAPALTDGLSSTVGPVPFAFLALIVVALILQIVLRRTRIGISLRAVGSDADSARLNGVSIRHVRLIGFVGCSLLAGFAALLLMAQIGTGSPTSGVEYTLTSISATVIGGASIRGGRGSFLGAVGAAALVTQAIAAVPFLQLSIAWASYLPGVMTLIAVALYSKSRQTVAKTD